MVNRIFIAVLLFCSSFPGFSQESSETPLKWELGVDLKSLFSSSVDLSGRTYGFILRRQLSNDGALRIRPDFYFNTSFKHPVKGANRPSGYHVSFDVGYEKQKKYKRFTHSYGIDLAIRREATDVTIGLGINDNNPTYSRSETRRQLYGLSVFTGGKYFMTDRISISLETNFNFLLEKSKNREGYVHMDNHYIINPSITESSGFYSKLIPISVIYLSYYL